MPSRRGAALAAAARDVRYGLWRFIPNVVAANHLVPGHLRMLLLRAAGLDVRSAGLRGGTRFTLANVTIEPNVFVNEGCLFEASGRITVGSGSLLGPGVMITTSNHELVDGAPAAGFVTAPVTVGRRCWIGANAVLLPGVTVADGVTVAAGAVVTHDLPAPGIYAGVPARPIAASARRAGAA